MANPYKHSLSSVKRWGGVVEDYHYLHKKMDCSKSVFPDNRHRSLTHHHFWINEVMIPIFGGTIKNSDGRIVSVKTICELHIMEDYRMKFIPTPQDWLQTIEMQNWMMNGFKEVPPSASKIYPNGVGGGFKELDIVITNERVYCPDCPWGNDLTSHIPAGAVGTIVTILKEGEAYLVEFDVKEDDPYVATVRHTQILPYKYPK